MNPEQKLAHIVQSLAEAGVPTIVMGGHAVRYYGIGRNTVDFDLVTALASPDELLQKTPGVELLRNARPLPSWRKDDFVRLEIDRLPDGRPEYLEFWLRNHLLDDFQRLKERAELGSYGGAVLPFLSLPDLLRSKETERESDWQDIELLEEIQDGRHLHAWLDGRMPLQSLLAHLRSRKGMDEAIERQAMANKDAVTDSLAKCVHPVAFAFLCPFAPNPLAGSTWNLEPAILRSLTSVEPGSPKHFVMVEIVRLWHKRRKMGVDRTDKMRRSDPQP